MEGVTQALAEKTTEVMSFAEAGEKTSFEALTSGLEMLERLPHLDVILPIAAVVALGLIAYSGYQLFSAAKELPAWRRGDAVFGRDGEIIGYTDD